MTDDKSNEAPKVACLTMPALGRVAQLGDLYDGRTDTFVPSITAFNSSLNAEKEPGDTSHPDYEVTQMNSVNIKFSSTDSLLDKLNSLDVKGNLSLSIMSGKIKASGYASYLNEEKRNFRQANFNLSYTYKSEHHQIRDLASLAKAQKVYLKNNKLWETIAPTHVVVGITWGAGFSINCEFANHDNKDKKKIEAGFELDISHGPVTVSGKVDGSKTAEEDEKKEAMTFNADCDVFDVSKHLPKDFDEARNMARELPSFVQKVNEGKGVPLTYILLSYDVLKKIMEAGNEPPILIEIEEDISNTCLTKVQHAEELIQRLNDLYDDMMLEKSIFTCSFEKEKYKGLAQLTNWLNETKSEFGKLFVSVKKGKEEAKKLVKLLQEKLDEKEMKNGKTFWDNAYDYREVWEKEITQKINFVKIFRKRGIPFLDTTESVTSLITDRLNKRLVVLYYTSYKEFLELGMECAATCGAFMKACKDLAFVDDGKPFFVVDGELHDNKHLLMEAKTVNVAYFDSQGTVKPKDIEKWKKDLAPEIEKKKAEQQKLQEEAERKKEEEKLEEERKKGDTDKKSKYVDIDSDSDTNSENDNDSDSDTNSE